MANFNKSFNFRGGFQVDDSVFLVRGQQVGIGSSVPTEALDVNGSIRAKGLVVTSEFAVGIESANVGFLSATTINVGVASINAGVITATTPAGIVTYYGDGRFLLGLPTSQWLDIDVGLGYTSIYAAGNVGVDTDDPRYKFQVGGVPFPTIVGPALPAQNGVGIEDGAIFASGIVSTRGTVVALGTVYTETEFIGVGSNITVLNADNIAIGSIGSMRYGDIITTKEVYADRFIGTSTLAESLVPGASISIESLRANTIDAVGRFISTEGVIQIGDTTPSLNTGDIQVKKGGFVDSSIFSIAEGGSSRMFVGTSTPAPSINSYGGIKFGGNSPTDISNFDDLDFINYDTGHLNFYINGGQTIGAGGEFRWISGRTNTVLASLDAGGLFQINEPDVLGTPSFEVVGISTLADVYITGSLNVTGSANLGDITISELTASSVGVVTLTADDALVNEEFIVGDNPTTGGTGGALNQAGVLAATSELRVGNYGSPNVRLSSNGDIAASGDISGVDSITANSLNVDGIDVTNEITSTNWNINNLGAISAASISVESLNVTGAVNLNDVNAVSLEVSGTVSATQGNFDSGSFTSISVTSLSVASIDSAVSLADGSSVQGDFAVTGDLTANTNVTVSGILSASTIESTGNEVTFNDNLVMNANLSFTGTRDITNVENLTATSITPSSNLDARNTLFRVEDNRSVRLGVSSTSDIFTITVFDENANLLGVVNLPF